MVAFFVKCGGSVAEDVHSADNYAHFVHAGRDLADALNHSIAPPVGL